MMRTTMMKSMMLTAMAAVLTSAPVSAMQSYEVAMSTPSTTTVETPGPRGDRARELWNQAEQLFSQPKQWRKAVKLLEQSAQLRDAGDADAYTCLIYASRIQASLGEFTAARQNLQKAAAHALGRGALVDAAHAYIDAAHVAIEEQQPQAAQEMVEKARLLAGSPLLSAGQREAVVARLR